jgi:tetratricopeptide (TPR) repeat protein
LNNYPKNKPFFSKNIDLIQGVFMNASVETFFSEKIGFFNKLLMKKLFLHFTINAFVAQILLTGNVFANSNEDKYQAALDFYMKAEYQKSLSVLERLLPENWNDYKTVMLAAFVSWKAKKYSWAVANFEHARQLAPKEMGPLISKTELYLEIENGEEAEKNAQLTVKIFPKESKAWNILAKTYLKTQKWQPAINAGEKSLSLKSDNIESYNTLGLAYLNLAKYDLAYIAFQTALSFSPRNAYLLNNLGVVKEKQREFEVAKEYYRKALEIYPDHPTARQNLARVS